MPGMRRAGSFILKWRGSVAGALVASIGVGLILSDRIGARHVGDRPWIVRQTAGETSLGSRPRPRATAEVVFDEVSFGNYDPSGSRLGDVVEWIGSKGRVRFDVDWRALARVGVDVNSRFPFRGRDVPLATLMDALCVRLSSDAGPVPPLAWATGPGAIVYLTSAADLAAERRWRQQRATEAAPALRAALDRPIPYVMLEAMYVDDALRFCRRLSGVTIDIEAGTADLQGTVRVFAPGATLEQALELILRNAYGDAGPRVRMRADGGRLVVFKPAGDR